jgi:hypothetical protein
MTLPVWLRAMMLASPRASGKAQFASWTSESACASGRNCRYSANSSNPEAQR